MKSLFDKTELAGMLLKNRFIRSATYEGFADKNGHMTKKMNPFQKSASLVINASRVLEQSVFSTKEVIYNGTWHKC